MSGSLKVRKNTNDNLEFCWKRIDEAQGNQTALNAILDSEVFHYQEMIEELLVNREKTLRLIQGIDKNIAIPSSDLDQLNLRMKDALNFLDTIPEVIGKNSCWIEADNEQMQALKLLPLDETLRLKGAMLALSGGLVLYDSYLTVVAILNEDERIRRFLNQNDIGYGIQTDQLQVITDDFISIANLSIIESEIDFYEQNLNASEYDLDI